MSGALSTLSEITPLITAVLPFTLKWGEDYFSKFPVVLKYTQELGSEASKPFLYVYGYAQTYQGFDIEKFKEIFRSNPNNADVSEEKLQKIANNTKFIIEKLREAFLQKIPEEELTQKQKDHKYLIPRDEEGKIAINNFINYARSTGASFARLNVPMLQLMFVPGAKTLGRELGMSEEELRMKTSAQDLFNAVLVVSETADLSESQRSQVEGLRRIAEASDVGSAMTVSASTLQEFASRAAASGDEQGLELAKEAIAKNPLTDYSQIKYGDIADPKVKDWVRALNNNQELPAESVVKLPTFMTSGESTVPEDVSADFYVPSTAVIGSAEGNGVGALTLALIIVLILIIALIASLPREIIFIALIVLTGYCIIDHAEKNGYVN